MKPTSQAAFDRIADMLRERECRMRIEGHTDNVPIHTSQFASNWELSTSRATEIVRLLIVRSGFAPDRLSAAGYAEYYPVATNLTAEGRGMNRRVDIVILGHARPDAAMARARSESGSKPPAAPPSTKPTAQLSPAAALKPRAVSSTGERLQH